MYMYVHVPPHATGAEGPHRFSRSGRLLRTSRRLPSKTSEPADGRDTEGGGASLGVDCPSRAVKSRCEQKSIVQAAL